MFDLIRVNASFGGIARLSNLDKIENFLENFEKFLRSFDSILRWW